MTKIIISKKTFLQTQVKLFILCVGLVSFSQLSLASIFDDYKGLVENVINGNSEEKSEKDSKKQPNTEKQDTNKPKASSPKLAYTNKFPPSVVLDSLLNHFEFFASGHMRLERVSVAFLPKKYTNGNSVDYDEDELFHIALKQGKNTIFDHYYEPSSESRIFTKFEKNFYSKKNIAPDFSKPLDSGKYTLAFYLQDKLFSEFNFEVYSVVNDDPYAEIAEKRFVRGPWNDYGRLYWEGKRSMGSEDSPALNWNRYFISKHMEDSRRINIDVRNELYKDGQYMATSGAKTIQADEEWDDQNFVFFRVGANERTDTRLIVRRKHLSDGNYTIRAYQGDRYDSFHFEIKNKKIVESGRQVRAKTDPTLFIEGLNKSWFVEKAN